MNNFKYMPQYPISRSVFRKIVGKHFPDSLEDTILNGFETYDFKGWYFDDEYYLLHKQSGTLINWYKHLGRCLSCNKDLSVEEYNSFFEWLKSDLIDLVVK